MKKEQMDFQKAIRDLAKVQLNDVEKYYSKDEIEKINIEIKKHMEELSQKDDNER